MELFYTKLILDGVKNSLLNFLVQKEKLMLQNMPTDIQEIPYHNALENLRGSIKQLSQEIEESQKQQILKRVRKLEY